ncbi:MAG: hypothetical protein C4314_07525 [Thermoflexus sp.]
MPRRSLTDALLMTYTIGSLIFIYFPLAMVVLLSFNSNQSISLPFGSFTTYWYTGPLGFLGLGGFFNDPLVLTAIWNSVYVALVVSALTTFLALTSALALRWRFPGRDVFFYSILAGLFIPGVLYGLGTAFMYHDLSLPASLLAVVPLQTVFALPFGLLLLLPAFDRELERFELTARTLGAGPWATFARITFPLVSFRVVGVAIFSFVISWGELIRSAFVSYGRGTLPLLLYSRVQIGIVTPQLYAIGTVVMALAVVLIVLAGLLLTRGRRGLFR